jgi:hypothetical protein
LLLKANSVAAAFTNLSRSGAAWGDASIVVRKLIAPASAAASSPLCNCVRAL